MKKSIFLILFCLILAFASTFALGCKPDSDGDGDPETPVSVTYSIAFDEFSMINGQTVNLDAKLLADGALATGNISYTSSDDSVISISNGVATAKKLGSASITVKANVEGKGEVAQKTVNCVVGVDAGIIANKHSYKLYISNSIHGVEYDTSTSVTAEVFSGGAKINGANVTWTSGDSSIATITSDGEMQAVKVGSTYIEGAYTDNTLGELKTVKIPVEVCIPVLSTKLDVIVDVTQAESAIDSNVILGNGKVAGKMVNNTTLEEYPVTLGKIPTAGLRTGEYRFTVYDKNNLMGCEVNLYASDYVVRNKTDFMNIYRHSEANYIVLANDIKNAGTYSCPADANAAFDGVFNGLGHTVSGVKFVYGLFNDAQDGATFKNVAFEDVTIEAGNTAVFFFRGRGANYFDNVYVQVDSIGSGAWGSGSVFAFCFGGTINMTNCVVIADGNIGVTNGALVGRSSGNFLYKNVFVISKGLICGTGQHVRNTKYNELNKLSIIYKTRQDFINERYAEDSLVDLSAFNDYWDLSTDVPTFK